jgi:hypothetical protein
MFLIVYQTLIFKQLNIDLTKLTFQNYNSTPKLQSLSIKVQIEF